MGRLVYLWRAVDAEGEVLHVLVQTRRKEWAAFKLMRELLKKYGFVPDKLVTVDLRSYGVAAGHLGIAKRHERGRWRNYNLRTIKKAAPFSSDLFSTPHRPANLGFPRENAGYPSALRPSGPTSRAAPVLHIEFQALSIRENGVLGEDGLGDEADCLGVHLWLSKIGSNLIYSNYWLKWPHIFRGLIKWGGCLNLICR